MQVLNITYIFRRFIKCIPNALNTLYVAGLKLKQYTTKYEIMLPLKYGRFMGQFEEEIT